MNRPRAICPDQIRQFFVGVDAAKRVDVFFRFFLDNIGDVVEGNDADQPIVGVDDRSRHPVIALEQARDFLLVLGGTDPVAVWFHQVRNRHRPFAAQQTIERHRP